MGEGMGESERVVASRNFNERCVHILSSVNYLIIVSTYYIVGWELYNSFRENTPPLF